VVGEAMAIVTETVPPGTEIIVVEFMVMARELFDEQTNKKLRCFEDLCLDLPAERLVRWKSDTSCWVWQLVRMKSLIVIILKRY
jgi:hypothetical protein